MVYIKNGTDTGFQGNNHIQGMAIDKKNGFVYYSFTTRLVKARLDGTIVGSVEGLVGHLGCIAFNEENGKIYGSLEFKHDNIGRGILERIGADITFPDAFYMTVFDGEKIDRMNMDACKDGVMKASYLSEVVCDYNTNVKKGLFGTAEHRYCCSGIDGTAFAPLPGENGKKYLYVAYGIYSDITRKDNDNQVILCYDTSEIDKSAMPLDQRNMHTSGPEKPLHKYFVFTGNTNWGVQNLSYDEKTGFMFLAVYHGKKKKYVNYDMFAVDMSVPAKLMKLPGLKEEGEMLSLYLANSPDDKNIHGWFFPLGQYGMPSLNDGGFCIAEPYEKDGERGAVINNYDFDVQNGFTLRTE